MKLLFDQNISYRPVSRLEPIYPQAKQIIKLDLTDFSDKEIWDFAKANNYVIVTFNSDFFDLSTFYGFPAKVIWLRTGNMTTAYLAQLLSERKNQIAAFVDDENLGCL